MTKKTYIEMAKVFHEAFVRTKYQPTNGIVYVMTEFIRIAKQDNPRFDEELFKKAVDLKSIYNYL